LRAAMTNHHFISYSTKDAQEFALKLCDKLKAGPPSIPAWLDKRELKPGMDWDDQVVEAIRTCESVIFVMSKDSVRMRSICKAEWCRALKYKNPAIPKSVQNSRKLLWVCLAYSIGLEIYAGKTSLKVPAPVPKTGLSLMIEAAPFKYIPLAIMEPAVSLSLLLFISASVDKNRSNITTASIIFTLTDFKFILKRPFLEYKLTVIMPAISPPSCRKPPSILYLLSSFDDYIITYSGNKETLSPFCL